MTNKFPVFADHVAASFQLLAEETLYVADIDGDTLYQMYLEAFPEGFNPLFKERTEHDCSCCKNFIRRVGNVVSGNGETIWKAAAKLSPYPYDEVATILHEIVSSASIVNLFAVEEKSLGSKETKSLSEEGDVLKWFHFYTGSIPSRHISATPDAVCGNYRTTVQVFERGLKELNSGALETVLELINGDLYRGEEHKDAVIAFRFLLDEYKTSDDKERFVWTRSRNSVARFRNTVIGTLVQDISDGVDVEKAVASFETKVAPQNYKRTSAAITPGMIKKAMQMIESLGLEPALERRFARLDDISVNDVLWVDSAVKPLMKGGLESKLLASVQTAEPNTDRAEDINLDDFMTRILPETDGMELYFCGSHLGNLMSLTAPVHPDPKQLFRWGNDFAWSYNGNIADSIAQRVKKAGGNTDAKLRTSLSWFNSDDLDIHVRGPGGHIYFHGKRGRCGGRLDVDMNVELCVRDAVENIAWERTPPDGVYKVSVRNYTHRESVDVGFVVEVESEGKVLQFNYGKEVRHREEIPVVALEMKNGAIKSFETAPHISTNAISQEKWGLHTEKFVRVNAVTLSPNYWGSNAVGNKHTFFVLEGAHNDEATRGIYNELLHPRLVAHRKVFEIIGEKTKCEPTEGQLSGVGFSSTKKDAVIVKVTQGTKQRLFNIRIGA